MNLDNVFDKFNDDYGNFADVTEKLHNRPDLCAFLILDRLVPGKSDMVDSAEHDEISLEVDTDALAAVATEEDIQNLVRCGVGFSNEGYLLKFV